jgi:hypothetical protein
LNEAAARKLENELVRAFGPWMDNHGKLYRIPNEITKLVEGKQY